MVNEDIQQVEGLFPETVRLMKKYGIHGSAGIPLLVNDQPIGVLMVRDKRVRLFTDDEVSLLSAFADQAALALEKARLLKEAETERERADSLYQVSNLLAGAHDTDEVLRLIVDEAARLLGLDAAYMRLMAVGELGASVATDAASGFLAGLRPSLDMGEGTHPAVQVIVTKKPVVLEDLMDSQSVPQEVIAAANKYGFRSAVVVPLLANDR